MKFTDYLDSIENTEQEQQLREQILILKKDLEPAINMPFIGKVFRALVMLGESENIDAFRRSGYYGHVRDWDIHVFDLEKGYFSIYPGAEQRRKIAKVFLAICLGIFILCLCRKCRRNRRQFID